MITASGASLEQVARGHAHGKVHEVARGQFVELEREGEDLIWTVLCDFGDAEHPGYTGGGSWRGRMATYDSTFGRESTDEIVLHWNSAPSSHDSQPAVPVFDDNIQYGNPATLVLGVIHPHTGTQIRIKSVSAQGSFMQVQVRPSK